MICCFSCSSSDDDNHYKAKSNNNRNFKHVFKQQKKVNNQINKKLKEWDKIESKLIKMLLLGPGESGKTTIIKQMKILHINSFTNEERMEKLQEIKENIFESIKELTSNMEYLNPSIKLMNKENEPSLNFIKNLDRTQMNSYNYPDEFFEHTKRLWSDPGIQSCYRRSNEFSLLDSAKYFLDKIDEIRDPNYIPKDQDILHSRKRTSDIQEIRFEMKNQPFCMFDVGGQRGERKKWFQVFDGIKTILFVVDSSGFDTKLREDGNINRLEESIQLFRNVLESDYLLDSGIILFFNKQDKLKEKIKNGHRIDDYFPEYRDYEFTLKNNNNIDDDEYEYMKARNFIKSKFEQVAIDINNDNKNKAIKNHNYNQSHREFYSHFTTATDTNNIKLVFKDVYQMCMRENFNYIVS